MRLALVKGIAWPSRKIDGIEGTRIVLVSPAGSTDEGETLAAADPLQASVGDYVLITEGQAAGAALQPGNPRAYPLDAAIVAIIQPDEVRPRLLD
ncbi:MAG: EutN/CcmL family microcompartment protein [Acidimicrobiales bacterium]|nr:EutN/CcmL family microcompartment protein [Acidimicrobiales bacterium]